MDTEHTIVLGEIGCTLNPGVPAGETVDPWAWFPEAPKIIEEEMERELAYIQSKIAYLERRDGIR